MTQSALELYKAMSAERNAPQSVSGYQPGTPWPQLVGNQKNVRARPARCGCDCMQGGQCPAGDATGVIAAAPQRKVIPLASKLTVDELRQAPMRWSGLTLAASIVLGIAIGVLVAHAIARQGWLS